MKLCLQISLVLLAISVGVVYKVFVDLSAPRPVPKVDVDAFWGPGLKGNHKPNAAIRPFAHNYSQQTPSPIEALRQTLTTKPLYLPAPLEGVGFEYGTNSDALRDIVRMWRDDYLSRWAEREAFLNQFPQFITQIQGLIQTIIIQKRFALIQCSSFRIY